ncbi:pentatricopeptide repeat-containing protein At3g13160, mitochondrial-like [Juglans microcarpa x Juglans regia]|uniref:pentatricopeptide repeat-containing protein At3g13160, mitochondrial-like n=1 Tax=Juglans microcarpa x Juglans regia TaxID=2249226 RepID=UPI001B7E2300|nr:pentatricopeptide repeat-containing protein At3g13160, mitochondrial-like [Juglans microcarpa x Juglans regia]
MSFSNLLRRSFSTSLQRKSPSVVKSVAVDIYNDRSLKRVVEKFKKSSEHERFRTRTGLYETVVRRLASAKCFNWIEEILEDQKKYRDISKEGFSVRLVSLYGKSGMFEHAQKVFDEMAERNCKRTVLSFNALLGACVNSKRFDLVDGIFRELPEKLSIEPDLVSYNTLINSFCQMGSFDSAVSMLDEMEKKGVDPDLITFNTILSGFYRNGRFSDGEKIWKRMEEKNIIPDIRSYNAKLDGLVLEKRTKEAVDLVEEMKKKSVKPDVFSFNALIKGYINEGSLEEAKRCYEDIGKSDLSPYKRTFELLLPFVCQKGEVDLAFELCKDVFEGKLLVDISLLQLVVDALVKESKIEEAKELVLYGKTNRYCRYNLTLPSDE